LGGGAPADAVFAAEASRLATSSFAFVDARARCAAASPPERRSQELSGGGCNPVDEPRPLSPRLIAGLSNSAKAGPIGCTSGRDAFEFGVLLSALGFGAFAGFFGVPGLFAMPRIWDESGRDKRAKALRRRHARHRRVPLSADVSTELRNRRCAWQRDGRAKVAHRHCLRQTQSVCARERSDEAIHLACLTYGLLRGACHRARIRATVGSQ
jgi:hypothetical protein